MAHSHDHSHAGHNHHNHHATDNGNIKPLVFSLVLTFIFMIIEFTGGFISNSLALISDAGHMLTDVGSLAVAVGAIYLGSKQSDESKTFGYKRLETIAAFINGITLIVISALIFVEGLQRLFKPENVNQTQIIIIASIGLLINISVAFTLLKGSKENVNMRGAFLHVLGDMLGSIGAIGAGLIIQFTGWLYADPLISILISIIIFLSSIGLLKETFHTLMEGTPKHINLQNIRQEILTFRNISDIHDLHVWSINESKTILTAHIVINEGPDLWQTVSKVKSVLHDKFNIGHSTLEIETIKCDIGCN